MSIEEEKSPEELQDEIEDARGHMKSTIDALQDRLSPTRAASQFSEWVDEEMGPMIRTASDALRKHSIPAAIAAGGLIWLTVALLRDDDEPTPVPPNRRLPARATGSTPGAAVEIAPGVMRRSYNAEMGAQRVAHATAAVRESAEALQKTTDALGDKSGGTWDAIKDKVSEAYEQAQSYIASGTQTAKGYLEDAYENTAEAVSGAGSSVAKSYDRSPLIYGLLAVAAGAAAALALPSTRREDALVGPYRDRVVDAAEHRADELRVQAEEATVQGLQRAAASLRESTVQLMAQIGDAQSAVSDQIENASQAVEGASAKAADRVKGAARAVAPTVPPAAIL